VLRDDKDGKRLGEKLMGEVDPEIMRIVGLMTSETDEKDGKRDFSGECQLVVI
jgi:hypothetical protein